MKKKVNIFYFKYNKCKKETLEKNTSKGVKSEDMEALANLYDLIREIQKDMDPEIDKILTEEFDEHVKNIILDLNSKLNKNSNEIIEKNIIVKVKKKKKILIYNLLYSKG